MTIPTAPFTSTPRVIAPTPQSARKSKRQRTPTRDATPVEHLPWGAIALNDGLPMDVVVAHPDSPVSLAHRSARRHHAPHRMIAEVGGISLPRPIPVENAAGAGTGILAGFGLLTHLPFHEPTVAMLGTLTLGLIGAAAPEVGRLRHRGLVRHLDPVEHNRLVADAWGLADLIPRLRHNETQVTRLIRQILWDASTETRDGLSFEPGAAENRMAALRRTVEGLVIEEERQDISLRIQAAPPVEVTDPPKAAEGVLPHQAFVDALADLQQETIARRAVTQELLTRA